MAEMVSNTAAGVVEEAKPANTPPPTSVANPEVFRKYVDASKIANYVLGVIVDACQPGVKINDMCKLGDTTIKEKLKEVYTEKIDGKTVDKGIGFPTCINVNNCLCHFSPLESDPNGQVEIRAGDWVKVDLGVHIDGYIAVAAHTIYGVGVEYTAEHPMSGKAADVVSCLLATVDVISRLARPGRTNHQLTRMIAKIPETYQVKFVAGTVMHQMRRYVIDGSKVMLLDRALESKVPECEFEVGDVFGFDIAVTSSVTGTPVDSGDFKPTVFKRSLEAAANPNYTSPSSRQLFNMIKSRHPVLPFSLSAIGNDKTCRLGIRELVSSAGSTAPLLIPYPVLHDAPDSIIAHVKFTCVILPKGNVRMTGLMNNSKAEAEAAVSPTSSSPEGEGEGAAGVSEATSPRTSGFRHLGLGRGCVRSDKKLPDEIIQFLMSGLRRPPAATDATNGQAAEGKATDNTARVEEIIDEPLLSETIVKEEQTLEENKMV